MCYKHSPYTVLVVEYDRFHYVDVETEEDALATVDSELSKDTTSCCIGYYWNPNWDCYSHLIEKHKGE
jgi:hypothetical protein